jgi:organic hydroperoxide reductase OsmC/OhrA
MTHIAVSACFNLCCRVVGGTETAATTTTTTTATKITKEQDDVQEHLEKSLDVDKSRKPE